MTHAASERIALVAPSAESAAVMRHDLIEFLARKGHRIQCLTPPGPAKYTRILKDCGAQHRVIEEPQPSVRLFTDWQTIAALGVQFSDWQPNVVLACGLPTLTLAAIAARRAKVRRVVSLVNGLPSDGIESVGRRRFTHAVRASDALVFHNEDNRRTLARLGLLPPNLPTLVVPGSGIDIRRTKAIPLPPLADGLTFLMLSRLERRRGVLEYKAAAREIKARWPDATFKLAGQPSREPDAIAPEALIAGGDVDYLGHLDDVGPALAACHVFVYPTYGEGMPRAILEALAAGRPIIATDTPGCNTTVDEKVSGCLVPPANTAALVAAIESYLRNPDQLAAGSRAARLKAERRFDAREVNAAFARILGVA